jgi:hypothetical protein
LSTTIVPTPETVDRFELPLLDPNSAEAGLRAEHHDAVSSTDRHPASVVTTTQFQSGGKMPFPDLS